VTSRKTNRLLFADRLRGLALVVMIETHVFNAMLSESLRQAWWFHVLNFVNGLVAPAFLFISGFVFLVSGERKVDEFRSSGGALWKQLRRIAVVWLIAYVLHVPPTVFGKPWTSLTRQDWLPLIQVDVLHCICVTWLFLLAGLIVFRSAMVRRTWLLASALAATVAAPWAWSVRFDQFFPAPLAAYFNDAFNSLFPVFPWSGFMLAGALCASLFLDAREQESRFMLWLSGLAAVFVALGLALPELPLAPGSTETPWQADPRTFILRLGLVFVLLCVCWLVDRRRQSGESWLFLVSRESLFVYVAHLAVLFAPVFGGRSLADVAGKSMGPGWCVLASLALLAAMVIGARGWRRVALD
jgi:uncharacterized membrane protein